MSVLSALSRLLTAGMTVCGMLALAGCGGLTDEARTPPPASVPAEPVPASASANGTVLGQGSVKIALILPLSGPGQAALAAAAMKNAADLAVSEFKGADLSIAVQDDHGTAEGARAATESAIADGAELILGPLFAPAVSAAGSVARPAGKPIIAFSTDSAVAGQGVYLLSFLPQPEVDRIVAYAAAQGRKSFAALIPDTVYGNVVEAEFREEAARRGIRVAAVERYASGQPGPAIARLASVISGPAPQADALFLPESADKLAAVGAALQAAGFNPQRVKPVGTGIWNNAQAFRVPALQGGWFAAPDAAGFNAFSTRYRARFGSDPVRIATLSYDAVSLAAALARTQGSQRFSAPVLQTPSGFAGADGVFRFRADGLSERALAVLEVRDGATVVVSPAPKTFGPSGT